MPAHMCDLCILTVHGEKEQIPICETNETTGSEISEIHKEILCNLGKVPVPLAMLARDVNAERQVVSHALANLPVAYMPLRNDRFVWLDAETLARVCTDFDEWWNSVHNPEA